MDFEARTLTLQRGAAALRAAVEGDESAPEWPKDGEPLLQMRGLVGVIVRLEMVLGLQGADDALLDMAVLGCGLEEEDDLLGACEEELVSKGPYRSAVASVEPYQIQAIQALRALLRQYGEGRFLPRELPPTDRGADG